MILIDKVFPICIPVIYKYIHKYISRTNVYGKLTADLVTQIATIFF